MKTTNLISILTLFSVLLLISSCATLDNPKLLPDEYYGTAYPEWENYRHGHDCAHQQNNIIKLSGSFSSSLPGELHAYCYTCGRNVRKRK